MNTSELKEMAARPKAAAGWVRGFAVCLVLAALVSASAPALALEAGDILVRARGIAVVPMGDSNGGLRPGLTTSGLEAQPMGVPELDFTYMVTDNIGVELILATSPHDLDVTGALSSLNKGAEVWLLPPTLLVQYHFMPDQSIRPYIGAGVNVTFTYAEDASASLEAALGGPTNVSINNSIGWAIQAGVDIDLDDRWFLNFDVKYVAITVDADIDTPSTGGQLDIEVDIDPIIAGIGIGYRF
jgi:outer membrane protein